MRRGSLILLILLLSPMMGSADDVPRHVGWQASDTFTQCAKSLLGKPVFISGYAADSIDQSEIDRPESVRCPASRDALLHEAYYLVPSEYPDFVYFNTRDEINRYLSTMLQSIHADHPQWALDETTSLWMKPSNSKLLGDSLVNAISRTIREQGRPVPSFWATRAGKKAFVVDERLFINAVELVLGRTSIIAFAPGTGYARVYFGELVGKEFRLAWDSPLIQGSLLGAEYRDLDGDGVPEILITNSWPSGSGPPIAALTVLDFHGKVLTPKSDDRDCLPSFDSCAIMGDEFSYVPGVGKRLDIVARFGSGAPRTYRLIDGTFQLLSKARRSRK